MNPSGKESTGRPRGFGTIRRNNQIEIPSALDYLPQVDEFIERKLKKIGIKKDGATDIAISVSEAVTNAIVHGNKNDLKKRVKVSLKTDSSFVEITVEDEGSGFDRSCLQCPTDEENLLKKAGRGLLIVESLMDKVDVLCGEQGCKVRMIKFLT